MHSLQLPKGAQFLALNLSELRLRGAAAGTRMAEVAQVIQEIRNVWNPLVVEGGLSFSKFG